MLPATQRKGLGPLGTLVRFGVLALVPVVALGAVLAAELNADVKQRYLDSAAASARLITQVGIQPLLSSGQLVSGLSSAEINEIDDRLQGASVGDQVRRLKVWNRNGTVVYSDNHSLIGRTYPIEEDLAEALEGHSHSGITNGQSNENTGDNLVGPLIEVYVPLVFRGDSSPSGAFELYLPYAPVQAAIDSESSQLYFLLAVGLTVFYAAMFPVVFLADRWRRRAESTAAANLAVLERLNRLKSEFLVRMSHQFRTAMVGIEGFSEVIRDSDRLDPGELRAFASDIHEDATRLDRAFNEMLELDQMESGGTEVRMEPADLNHLVENVIQSQTRRITWQADRSLPKVPCDAAKITQALGNIVGNAVKYSSDEIVVTSRLRNEQAEITVADHGPGMPDDFDAHLFIGHSNGAGVTGLGLPIARQIVEMHGGQIWFESVEGRGTTFHLTLPVTVRPSRVTKAVPRA
jgi:signal transduction histidine kinase